MRKAIIIVVCVGAIATASQLVSRARLVDYEQVAAAPTAEDVEENAIASRPTGRVSVLLTGEISLGPGYFEKTPGDGGRDEGRLIRLESALESHQVRFGQAAAVIGALSIDSAAPRGGRARTLSPPQRRRLADAFEALSAANVTALSLASPSLLAHHPAEIRRISRLSSRQGITPFGAPRGDPRTVKPLWIDEPLGKGGGRVKIAVLAVSDPPAGAAQTAQQLLEVSYQELAEQIRAIKADTPRTFVVVYASWRIPGRQKHNWISARAHALTDAGADLIVGHGSHMLEQARRHKRRWAFHGIGDLVSFDGEQSRSGRRGRRHSGIVEVSFRKRKKKLVHDVRLHPLDTETGDGWRSGRLTDLEGTSRAYWHLLNETPSRHPRRQLKKSTRLEPGTTSVRFLASP